MSEYIVNFGDTSSAFVRLAMAEAEAHGARIAEPIVRCRDCKWFMPYSNATYCDRFASSLPPVEPDDFCSWGDLRGDAE